MVLVFGMVVLGWCWEGVGLGWCWMGSAGARISKHVGAGSGSSGCGQCEFLDGVGSR